MHNFRSLAIASVSLMAVAAPAWAQDEPAADNAGAVSGGEIVVAARRKDESLQEVPLSIQAVTGNQLAKLELRSFQDVAAIVPGLQLNRAQGGIQNTVTMRGVSFNPTSTGPQTAVELYRNDVPTTSAAIFQALYDIGQLEVLRGPQGTLRGRASPSGSITITTKRPNLDEVGGFAEGTVAQRGKWVGTGALNVPIVEGKLGVRVAGYVSEGQGNEIDRRAIGGKQASDGVQSLRVSVRADPFDGVLVLDANYETTRRKTISFEQYESAVIPAAVLAGLSAAERTRILASPLVTADDRVSIQSEPGISEGKFHFYNWQAQFRQWGQVLTYVGGRLDTETTNVAPEDFGGIVRGSNFAPSTRPDINGIININQFAAFTTPSAPRQRAHEVRLQNEERLFGMFDYVVGYLNLRSTSDSFLMTPTSACVGGATNCAVGGLANVTLGSVLRFRSDREESFFGNLTLHLGDSTEFSGGVRRIKFARTSGLQSAGRIGATLIFDREPLESVVARPDTDNPALRGSDVFFVNDSVKHTIFTLSAKHSFSQNLMVYANYGTSFRPGNILVCSRCSTLPAAPDAVAANPFLRPADETSRSMEAGIKASLFDRQVTANLSVFRQSFKNFTIGTADPVQFLALRTGQSFNFQQGQGLQNGPLLALSGTTNTLAVAVPVRIIGFEAELGFRPSDRFNLAANVAFSDSKVRGGARLPCVDLDNDNFTDPTPVPNTAAGAAALEAGVTPAGGNIDTCLITRASAAPKWSAAAQAEYNHPFGDSLQGFARGLLSYFGKTGGDEVNGVDSVSAYTLLNLYAGLRDPDGAWEVSLFGKNLFGTDRILTRTAPVAASTIAGVTYLSAYRRITTTSPREFGVTAKIAFGSR